MITMHDLMTSPEPETPPTPPRIRTFGDLNKEISRVAQALPPTIHMTPQEIERIVNPVRTRTDGLTPEERLRQIGACIPTPKLSKEAFIALMKSEVLSTDEARNYIKSCPELMKIYNGLIISTVKEGKQQESQGDYIDLKSEADAKLINLKEIMLYYFNLEDNMRESWDDITDRLCDGDVHPEVRNEIWADEKSKTEGELKKSLEAIKVTAKALSKHYNVIKEGLENYKKEISVYYGDNTRQMQKLDKSIKQFTYMMQTMDKLWVTGYNHHEIKKAFVMILYDFKPLVWCLREFTRANPNDTVSKELFKSHTEKLRRKYTDALGISLILSMFIGGCGPLIVWCGILNHEMTNILWLYSTVTMITSFTLLFIPQVVVKYIKFFRRGDE